MRQTLKRLSRMIIGYGAVQWAGPVIALVFTPIITRLLDPTDYGVADYALTIGSVTTLVALVALPQALLTHFNDRQDPEWQRRVTGSALAVALVLAVLASVVLVVLAPWIAQASYGNQTHTRLFQLIGATFAFGTTGAIVTTAAQAALRVRWGMTFSVVVILATISGNLLFIVILRLGPLGLLLTPILTGMALSVAVLVKARSLIGRPDWSTSRLLLRSGGWLLPGMASAWVLQLADRLFLVHYVSPAEMGYYAIANKFTSLIYVALAPLYTAWTPLALAMQHDPRAKERYADMSRIFVALVLLAALGLSLFSTEILMFLTRPAYLPASPYVGFLAYAQVFGGIGVLFYTGALAGKRLKAVSWSAIAGALVNLVLNFLLIPAYGLWGATIATVIGVAIPQVLLYTLGLRSDGIPYPIGKLVAAMLVQFGLVIAGFLVPDGHFWIRVAVKMALLGLLPLAYVWLGIISVFELRQGLLFLRHRLRLVQQAYPHTSVE